MKRPGFDSAPRPFTVGLPLAFLTALLPSLCCPIAIKAENLKIYIKKETLVWCWQSAWIIIMLECSSSASLLETGSHLVSQYFAISTSIHGAIYQCHLPNTFYTCAAPYHHTPTSACHCQSYVMWLVWSSVADTHMHKHTHTRGKHIIAILYFKMWLNLSCSCVHKCSCSTIITPVLPR